MSHRATAAIAAVALAAAIGGCQNKPARAAGPLILAPPDCGDINFPIYFEPRSAAVTREAAELINVAGARSRGCDVTGIVVIGLADARGAPGANLDTPVIFITAFPERLLTGERPEPTFLITKPFQPETVKAAIGQALFFHPRRAKAA